MPSTKIPHILEEIILLLRSNKEENWAIIFERLLKKFNLMNNKKESAREILHIFRGGMGSLNDLVLQKDTNMLVEENNRLENLKKYLFNLCLETI